MYKVGDYFVPDEEKDEIMLGGLRKGGWQLDHLEASLKFVKKFDVALDIGANIGSWSMAMSKKFKTVHSFEPVPTTFECLEINTKGYNNVHINNFGLGHKDDFVSFGYDPVYPNNTGGRFVNGSGDIPIKRLDDLNLENIDYIKIDVEGFEANVLEGGFETISNSKPVMLIEYKARKANMFGGLKVLDEMIKKLNYKNISKVGGDIVFVHQNYQKS